MPPTHRQTSGFAIVKTLESKTNSRNKEKTALLFSASHTTQRAQTRQEPRRGAPFSKHPAQSHSGPPCQTQARAALSRTAWHTQGHIICNHGFRLHLFARNIRELSWKMYQLDRMLSDRAPYRWQQNACACQLEVIVADTLGALPWDAFSLFLWASFHAPRQPRLYCFTPHGLHLPSLRLLKGYCNHLVHEHRTWGVFLYLPGPALSQSLIAVGVWKHSSLALKPGHTLRCNCIILHSIPHFQLTQRLRFCLKSSLCLASFSLQPSFLIPLPACPGGMSLHHLYTHSHLSISFRETCLGHPPSSFAFPQILILLLHTSFHVDSCSPWHLF